MLSVAAEKKEELQLNNTQFIHGNAMELPFGDNSFDYVTIGVGVRNVPDYVTVLNEMYRVVKPGGEAVCLETSQATTSGDKHLDCHYVRFNKTLTGRLWFSSIT